MSSIILHISDLHVSLDKKIGGETNEHDSYLNTSSNKEPSYYFIDKFISTIEKNFKSDKIYFLITGDTANNGEKKEFDFALEFLNRIIDKLKINKTDILLIPGDHDLNRRDITNILVEDENSSPEQINIAKFRNFKDFYTKLLEREFDANKIVFDTLLIEDSILLVGLNSCNKIDLSQKLGNIPISQLENEIKLLDNRDKKMIACVHHNLTSSYDNKNDGQWDSSNRQSFLDELLKNRIGYVFTGNEHTNNCKSLFLGEITTSDSGCISTKRNDATFKVYPVVINDDIILKNKIFSLQKTNNNDSIYDWDVRTNKVFSQPEEFVIFKKIPPLIDDSITEILDNNAAPLIEVTSKLEVITSSRPMVENYYSPEFTDILYDKVKELNIFHTGHFHWRETSRVHNWIDVSKLIEDKDNLNFAKNAIVDVIEKKISDTKIDLIIGLGYEGNLISTKASIKYGKPYCFLPYSYRYEEHHEAETFLNFENEDKRFENVLIITDVVNDGRTIRKLVKKRQGDFFKNVKKIFVVSLFYTGQSHLAHNILNYDYLEKLNNYDIENDEQVNNIEFYTVKSLKVEKCPYGKDFRSECFIFKDQLNCVHLFYDDSKYLK